MNNKEQGKDRNHLQKDEALVGTNNSPIEEIISAPNSMITMRGNVLHLMAFTLYAVVALLYFALPVIGNFGTQYIGYGADPTQFMWSFKWIIYAITHGANPFYTNLIWAPGGYNLSFSTFTPGISLLSIPVTLWLGAVKTYNIWQILNPALGAYFTFVICYYLTKKYMYSLVGGYVFGFSSFEIAQTLGHLQVSTIFLIPLMVYLLLLMADNKIKKTTFAMVFSLSLIFQFLFSLEVFTTFTFCGVIIIMAGYLCLPSANRLVIRKCIMPVALSYLICLIAVSPYLYFALKSAPKGVVHDPFYWVNDLLNFVVPTPLTFLGKYFTTVSTKFTGNFLENDAYFGIGFFTIVALFTKSNWKRPPGRILFLAFIIPAIASLGPIVHVLGKATFPSPFYHFASISLLKDALPNRMVVFASMPLAVIVSMWLANGKLTWPKLGLILLSILLIIPSLPCTSSPAGVPPFITDSQYKKYISKGSNVLIIPYSSNGNSMLWQAETNFYFTMAGGYLGPTPPAYSNLPVLQSFIDGKAIYNLDEAVRLFIVTHDIKAIIVDSSLPSGYLNIFNGLGVSPRLVGGVWLYQITDGVMEELRSQMP